MGRTLAFALAGLGGFNAHGAGFLTAARELNVRPDLVTATSGQIVVLGEWLRGTDLKAFLVKPDEPKGPLGTAITALTGDPGVFRPAIPEYWERWQRWPVTYKDWAAALFPAQEYISLRSQQYLGQIADQLNASATGVTFITYDPKNGIGTLYGNDASRGMLEGVPLERITAQAIASALWLSLYGFDNLPNDQMDGAYYRSCIVAELHDFDTIFAVRPLAQGWRGKVPSSWFDVQDWQCEMWFSASYRAEVADMMRINELIQKKLVTDQKYKFISLIEVATERPAGYFNFFSERSDVFDAAYQESKKKLQTYLNSEPVPPPI
jgi:hypothetical protein